MYAKFFRTVLFALAVMTLSACQAKESTADLSQPVVPTEVSPLPSRPSEPTQSSWKIKMQNCPHELNSEMTWQQAALTSQLIRQNCSLNAVEFNEMVKEKLGEKSR